MKKDILKNMGIFLVVLLCVAIVIEYGKAVFWYVFFVLTLMWLLLFIDDKFIDDNDKKD